MATAKNGIESLLDSKIKDIHAARNKYLVPLPSIDREAISKLPGFDTKIYDDMVKQADSSAKLNFAIAMMQAGFGAAGASAKQGETPISTLSRTLLAPLSGAAGKVASDSRKEKTAARLGKLAADGRISSTAYTAALAQQTAGQALTDKVILQHFKSKIGTSAKPVNMPGTYRMIVGPKKKVKGQKPLWAVNDEIQVIRQLDSNGVWRLVAPALDNLVITPKVAKIVSTAPGSGGDPVNALQQEKWRVFRKTIAGQIPSLIENIDPVEKKLGYKGGKFTYFNQQGKEVIFDDKAQPFFRKLLEDKIYAEHPKFGGVEQKGSEQSKNFLSKSVRTFFRTKPATILGNMAAQIAARTLSEDARVYPTSTALTKIMEKNITKAKDNNNTPFSEIAVDVRPDNALSRKPIGLLIDALNTDRPLFGPETTGNVFNPAKNSSNRIGNRLIMERLMKSIPKNQTSATNPKLATASNRYSVLEKARDKKLDEVSKKLSSPASLKKQQDFNDLIRSVKLIDGYNKAQVIGGVEGFIKGAFISGTQKLGINPQVWWTSAAGIEAKRETIAIREILEQISARGVLSATGEDRFTDKDLKGAQKLFGSMSNDAGYNATALKQMRSILMGGIKSMLGQTGSFKISNEMIEEGLKLGAKSSNIIVNRADQGGYSKYYPKKYRAYEVSKQFAPGVSPEELTRLEELGVLEPFKAPGGDYQIYKTQKVTDANGNVSIQPVIENGEFKMLNVDYDTLMDPRQDQNRAFSFNFFKKNLRR